MPSSASAKGTNKKVSSFTQDTCLTDTALCGLPATVCMLSTLQRYSVLPFCIRKQPHTISSHCACKADALMLNLLAIWRKDRVDTCSVTQLWCLHVTVTSSRPVWLKGHICLLRSNVKLQKSFSTIFISHAGFGICMRIAVAVVAEKGQSCQEGGCNVGRGMLRSSTFSKLAMATYRHGSCMHRHVECSWLICTSQTSVCGQPVINALHCLSWVCLRNCCQGRRLGFFAFCKMTPTSAGELIVQAHSAC